MKTSVFKSRHLILDLVHSRALHIGSIRPFGRHIFTTMTGRLQFIYANMKRLMLSIDD